MATILVVDDQEDNRYYLTRLLGHGGHRALEAEDGEQALQVAKSEHPDLIISDILMPKMDGYEFVHRLRQDDACARTPVIFSSAAYEEEEVRPLAEQCGVATFLRKPALPSSVFELIDEALGSTPSQPVTIADGEVFDRDHSRVLLSKLAQKVSELESSNRRLFTLVELGQQLTLAKDVRTLLEHFCKGAREVIGAACAAVCILSDDLQSISQFIISGIETDGAQPPSIQSGLLARLFEQDSPLRQRFETDAGLDLGLPPSLLNVRSFLGAPIRSGGLVYGLLYLVNKDGAEEFSFEDESLAATLASQIAVGHENARRQESLCLELAERRQAEERVRQLNAELEQRVEERTADLRRSNSELEQFAYVASHDLQEPLRKIASFSQLLADHYRGQLGSDADEFIGYITNGVQRMQSLIHDLLAFSRSGRKPLVLAPVDCEVVLQAAIQNLKGAIDEAGAVITHDPLPRIPADLSELSQLFQNIIGNAIKYHGPQLPKVHVGAERTSSGWVFSVRDNGIGIRPEFFDRIFVIFQRLHTQQEYPGTGIGLAICKKIVERHGGRIWVESQPGHGATFHFTLADPRS